jgi:type I restriction enzyme M protein
MNMILHDVHFSRFDMKLEDTLEYPQHNKLEAEAVVANPPFSAQWSANQLFMTDDRFSEYGRLAPSVLRLITPLYSTCYIIWQRMALWLL